MGKKLVHVHMDGTARQIEELKPRLSGTEGLLSDYVFVFTKDEVQMQVDVVPILEEMRDLMKRLVELKEKQMGV